MSFSEKFGVVSCESYRRSALVGDYRELGLEMFFEFISFVGFWIDNLEGAEVRREEQFRRHFSDPGCRGSVLCCVEEDSRCPSAKGRVLGVIFGKGDGEGFDG